MEKRVVNAVDLIIKEIRTKYWQETNKLPLDEDILEILNACK